MSINNKELKDKVSKMSLSDLVYLIIEIESSDLHLANPEISNNKEDIPVELQNTTNKLTQNSR